MTLVTVEKPAPEPKSAHMGEFIALLELDVLFSLFFHDYKCTVININLGKAIKIFNLSVELHICCELHHF